MYSLSEINEIEYLLKILKDKVRAEVILESRHKDVSMPIYKLSFGSADPEAPSLGLVGGIHGLERIGSQVCLSLLSTFSQMILWDENLNELLKKVRIYFIPTVNPIGLMNKTRSNPRGVDLMRNSPVDAEAKVPFLIGGQRYSSKLPWYRGLPGEIEPENLALIEAVKRESFKSKIAVTVDFHSGFGVQDQIWFPYAKSRNPIYHLPELYNLISQFDKTFQHHFYKIEPQFYLTHGDIWDHLYDTRREEAPPQSVYLPFTLEMGSWIWVKKNPMQFFRTDGFFNPILDHRYHRVLRRHYTIFDFLIRAIHSSSSWVINNEEERKYKLNSAKVRWYGNK